MESPLLKAQHYLDQAQNMRRLAAAEDDPASRERLLELAKGYDRLSAKFLKKGQEAQSQAWHAN